MIRRLLAICTLLLLLAGCAKPTTPPQSGEPSTPTYPRDQVVLQVAHGGGFRMIDKPANEIPDVTIWGDGRVVFVAADLTIREGKIDQATLDRLVRDAAFLYELQNEYAAAQHTDDATAFFTVLTAKGRKTVSVYALNPLEAGENEPHPTIFARLRSLWAEVQGALPTNAPEFKPTAVRVIMLQSELPTTAVWPAELKGPELNGAQATQAVELAGLREAKTFLVDGQPMLVMLVPLLPQPGAW